MKYTRQQKQAIMASITMLGILAMMCYCMMKMQDERVQDERHVLKHEMDIQFGYVPLATARWYSACNDTTCERYAEAKDRLTER